MWVVHSTCCETSWLESKRKWFVFYAAICTLCNKCLTIVKNATIFFHLCTSLTGQRCGILMCISEYVLIFGQLVSGETGHFSSGGQSLG